MPPKRSPVYSHFDDIEGNNKHMQCKLCKVVITKKSWCLQQHLKAKHDQAYNEYEKLWKYFDREGTKARCKVEGCSALLIATATTALSYHLEKIHKIFKASSIGSSITAASKNKTEIQAQEGQQPQNCFTCNSELGSCRIPISCRTETTQTPLKELLESIGDISLSQKNKSEGVLCNQCYTVVERFDYLQDQSRKVQVRLVGMLKRAQPEEIYIKEEPEESIDDEYELSNADESDDDDDWTEMHQSKRRRTSATKRRRTSARESPNDEMKDETKDEIDFNCKECSEKFKTDLCLQMHLATDHDRNEGEVDCPICFKTCKDRSSLKQHYTRHTLPRSLLCGQCGATFAHKSSFDMHMLMHEDKKEFACSIAGCSMKFISNGKLLRHLRVHSGEKTLKHSKLKHQQGLNMHNKNLDKKKDANSEVCKICGVRIPSKAKMKQHLTKIHDVILDDTNE